MRFFEPYVLFLSCTFSNKTGERNVWFFEPHILSLSRTISRAPFSTVQCRECVVRVLRTIHSLPLEVQVLGTKWSEGKTLPFDAQRIDEVGLVPMPTTTTIILVAQCCTLWKTRLSMAEHEYDNGRHRDRREPFTWMASFRTGENGLHSVLYQCPPIQIQKA